MTDPRDYETYLRRFERNRAFTQEADGLVYHMPCPFCAAADFALIPQHDNDAARIAMAGGGTCRDCGRSGHVVFQEVGPQQFVVSAFVQTGGPSQADWLVTRFPWRQ